VELSGYSFSASNFLEPLLTFHLLGPSNLVLDLSGNMYSQKSLPIKSYLSAVPPHENVLGVEVELHIFLALELNSSVIFMLVDFS
jgi:hypothetical protein